MCVVATKKIFFFLLGFRKSEHPPPSSDLRDDANDDDDDDDTREEREEDKGDDDDDSSSSSSSLSWVNELRVALRRSARKKADDENDDENDDDDDEKSTPSSHRRRCNRRFGTDMDEWLEKARKGGDGWRTRENVVDGLLPFLAAEYENAKREALVFSSRKEFEDDEEEEEEEGAQKNALLRKISNAKLKAMYDEFFDVYGDLLAMNDVKRDKEMFLEWLESKVCSASEGRSTRVGRDNTKFTLKRGGFEKKTKKDDVQSYLRKRNESLRKFRVMKSKALYECCDDERSVSTRSKFLAIVLEGFMPRNE